MHTCSTTRACPGERWTWRVEDLWKAAEGLPVNEFSVREVAHITDFLDTSVWEVWCPKEGFSFWDLSTHLERILEADLSYPINASPEGSILDGVHRLVKANIYRQKVLWQQFDEWPEPWKKEKVS